MIERHEASGALPRERLVGAILDSERPVVIEAPAGYGKTALLRELGRRDPGALYVGRRSDLHYGVDAPTVLVDVSISPRELDDIGHARIVLASRRVNRLVREQLVQAGALVFGAQDLRFDDAEVAAMLATLAGADPTADDVRSVAGITEGWPAAVDAIARYRAADPAADWNEYGPHLDQLVDTSLIGLSPAARRDFAQLCHLSTFTSGCIRALPTLPDLPELLEEGCPLVSGADGWIRVPRLLTMWARSAHEIDQDTVLAIAPVLLATASPERALRALLAAGLVREAADMLADLPERQIDRLEPNVGHALLDLVAPYADEVPALHLLRARLHRNSAEFGAQADALARAERSGDPPVVAQAQLELLVMASRQGWSHAHEARLDHLLADTAPDGSVTASVAEIRAFAAAHDRLPSVVRSARDQFERAAAAWEMQRDERRAAAVLRSAATTSLFHLGEYRAATRLLEQASDLCWSHPLDRAVTTVLRCRFESLAGRVAEFERLAPEAEALADTAGLEWLHGYLAWAHMWAAAWRGDPRAVANHQRDADRFLGELSTTPTGHLFLAESASCLAIVGEHERADELLRSASSVEIGIEWLFAELVVAGRSPDRADAAHLAARLLEHPHVPAERQWRVWVEQLRLLDRDADGYEALADDVDRYAERQGLGELAALLASEPPAAETAAHLRVEVLGGFRVVRAGAELDLPSGHVATTVKALAVHGGVLSVDRLADILWPDAWLDEGRQRLKNVVKRVRDALGPNAIERHGDTVSLGSDVAADLIEFNERARAAQRHAAASGGAVDAVGGLVDAVGSYGGPVLPTDDYDDWVQPVRQSTQALAEAMLAQLCAVPPTQRPPASWLLGALLDVNPDDDRQLSRIARLALDEGDHATTRTALRLAKTAARAVDVDLVVDDAELDAIVAMV